MKKAVLLVAVPVTLLVEDGTTAAQIAGLESRLRHAIGDGLLTGSDSATEVVAYDISVQLMSEEPVEEALPAVPGFIHLDGDSGVPLYELDVNACLSAATADTLQDLLDEDDRALADAITELARQDADLAAWLKEPEQKGHVFSLAIDEMALLTWLRIHRNWQA